MKHKIPNVPKETKEEAENELFDALLSLANPDECRRFLRDICTPKEIKDLADRWRVARILDEQDFSYRDIHSFTGISVTTVGRVARFLRQENYQGYRKILDRRKLGRSK